MSPTLTPAPRSRPSTPDPRTEQDDSLDPEPDSSDCDGPLRKRQKTNESLAETELIEELENTVCPLSTKRRLGQGALDLVTPRQSLAASGPVKPMGHATSPMRTGSTSIMKTGFRKPAVGCNRGPGDMTLAALNAQLSPGPSDRDLAETVINDISPFFEPIHIGTETPQS